MNLRTLSIILALVFGIAVVSVIILAGDADSEARENVRFELVKYLLQLAVVIVVGGVIATLLKTVEHSREVASKKRDESLRQAHLRTQIHEEYLRKVGSLYRAVKCSRRVLRACGLTTKHGNPGELTGIQIDSYHREMTNLNNAQLELEGLVIESERLPVFVEVGALAGDLRSMENYLRDVLSEYEKYYPKMLAGEKIEFKTLARVSEFTASTRAELLGDRFNDAFWKPYDRVLTSLGAAITNASC